MHFYYLDEAGCTGEDLDNSDQPIFVAGGIVVRDEGWNKSKSTYDEIIRCYFGGEIPSSFELHTHQLLSPRGDGFFEGHDRDRRSRLAHDLLDLLAARNHQTCYLAIDKQKLRGNICAQLRSKEYLGRRAPYVLAYDYLVSQYDWFTKEKLGRSARGMVIADKKDGFDSDVAHITHYRRYGGPKSSRVKWLTEFTYAIDSHKNPMVQLSDLVCFITKTFLEVDAGYRNSYSPAAKTAFRDLYIKIHRRLLRKEILAEQGRNADEYNSFMQTVSVLPSRQFMHKVY
jgi:hypothetical protein